MNRINKVFQKDGTIMSIYFTAGFPTKNDTLSIIKELDSAGVEMIEIGLPFRSEERRVGKECER